MLNHNSNSGDKFFSGEREPLSATRGESSYRASVASGWWRVFVLMLVCVFGAGPPAAALAAQDEPFRGKASWYGTTAHGKKTASGESFDRNAMMAAHKTLPFGTVVRVFNLRNNRQILVRINDRGPFAKGRIVDVSMRAAEHLKMKRAGVVTVAIEAVSNTKGVPLNPENSFYLHIADERVLYKALSLSSQLKQRLNRPTRTLLSVQDAYPTHAVCLGPYDNFKEAELVLLDIEKKKIPSRGIIEAPTKGGDIPRHVPPSRQAGKKGSERKRPPG